MKQDLRRHDIFLYYRCWQNTFCVLSFLSFLNPTFTSMYIFRRRLLSYICMMYFIALQAFTIIY